MLKVTSTVITGASSGIGWELALQLARPGTSYCLISRNQTKLDSIQALCEQKGAVVRTYALDIAQKAKLQKALLEYDQEFPVDLVVANAGVGTALSASLNGGKADYEKIIQTNILGIHHTVEPLIPLLKSRGSGQIALMSSLASYRGYSKYYIYNATKAYVRIYGQGLRLDLKKFGISVSTIAPGFIKTPLTDKNGFKMPLLMSPEKACKKIIRGLQKKKSLIAFPKTLYYIVHLLASLPAPIADYIASKIK